MVKVVNGDASAQPEPGSGEYCTVWLPVRGVVPRWTATRSHVLHDVGGGLCRLATIGPATAVAETAAIT